MRKKISFILFSCFSLVLFGQSPTENLLQSEFLKTAGVSLLVEDLESKQPLCSHNSEKSIVPASTMKLVTTATALEVLGADFRFETRLEIDANVDENGVLQGNLYIRGGGDPTLGSDILGNKGFLKSWVDAIKKVGIKKIKGAIIADATIFDDEGINPLWLWEDLGNYYASAAYGISYKDNTCKVYFKSGEIGTNPKILKTVPNIPELKFENHLKATTVTYDKAYFNAAPHSNNKMIYGEIPANRKSFVVKTDIPRPGLVLARDFRQLLLEGGVSVDKAADDKVAKKTNRTTIHKHFSPTLSKIVKEINFNSNNHYAEHLFRFLALEAVTVATNRDAARYISSFWEEKGLPVDQLFMYDGSGLAPANAVSSAFFVSLLRYMKQESKHSTAFYNSLPRAGREGTLAPLLKQTALEGKLRAKSGSIRNVRAFAGYMEQEEKTYLFAILVNNYNGRPRTVLKNIEKLFLELAESKK